MGKIIINLGLFAFLILSVLVFYLYFGMLLEKICRPHFKNLGAEGFLIPGVPIIGLLSVDFFIVKRLWKSFVHEVHAGKRQIK
jgi:hypothetical protein